MGIKTFELRRRAALLCALLGVALAAAPAHASTGRANPPGEAPSGDARALADWVVGSSDNQGLPFILVDKAQARLFLFDRDGAIQAAVPVLLGLARGDVSPPGIGERPLSAIAPGERITPAGRFFASMGEDLSGNDILWIDYGAAVALHRLSDPVPGLTAGGRAARLASASTADNRISHGCVNVSVEFFETMVRPAFGKTGGIVYVLPETRSIEAVFPMAGMHREASGAAGGPARES